MLSYIELKFSATLSICSSVKGVASFNIPASVTATFLSLSPIAAVSATSAAFSATPAVSTVRGGPERAAASACSAARLSASVRLFFANLAASNEVHAFSSRVANSSGVEVPRAALTAASAAVNLS